VTDSRNKDKPNRSALMAGRRRFEGALLGISNVANLALGEKVRAARPLRNDGTYPHKDIGEILVREGDVGYVFEIVKFCGEVYYTVEFVERAVVVGTRRRDLVGAGDQ